MSGKQEKETKNLKKQIQLFFSTLKMYGLDTPELMKRISNVRDDISLNLNRLQITELPPLPDTLEVLMCSSSSLRIIRSLPKELKYLYCHNTPLLELPDLPKGLLGLQCSNTLLTSLPELPPKLDSLICSNTLIKELPTLPEGIREIYCHSNSLLSVVPSVPSSLYIFYCKETAISLIPRLPLLYLLNCEDCPNLLLKHKKDENQEQYILRWRQWWDEEDSKKRCQERNETIKEDLMAEMWKPSRVEKMLELGGWKLLDSY